MASNSRNFVKDLNISKNGGLQTTNSTVENHLQSLVNYGGAGENDMGTGSVRLQTFAYGRDATNGKMKPLKLDGDGRLECSVDALEVTAETINLNVDTLEAKIQATNDKLDSFSGAGNNNVGEGSTKLQTYLYARDVGAGNFKPLVCDSDAHLQVDVLSNPDEVNDFAHNGTLLNNVTLTAGAVNTTTLDLTTSYAYKQLNIFGNCGMTSSTDNFNIMVSNDNSNYYVLQSIRPVLDSISSTYNFAYRIQNLARYIRISNPSGNDLTNFTLNYVSTK